MDLNKFTVPKTVESEVHLHLRLGEYRTGEFTVWDHKSMSGKEYLYLATATVKFDTSSHSNLNLRGEVVKSLEAKKDEIRAEFVVKERHIQDQIDSLLAITYEEA